MSLVAVAVQAAGNAPDEQRAGLGWAAQGPVNGLGALAGLKLCRGVAEVGHGRGLLRPCS